MGQRKTIYSAVKPQVSNVGSQLNGEQVEQEQSLLCHRSKQAALTVKECEQGVQKRKTDRTTRERPDWKSHETKAFLQQKFWVVIVGKPHVLLGMWLLFKYPNNPWNGDREPEAAKWISHISNCTIYTRAFTGMCQNGPSPLKTAEWWEWSSAL